MPRKILHIDLDAFFCAVEEQHNPDLVGKAFAVGGSADERGVVSSCSYAARACGVRSAMPMARAERMCPGLIRVPPTFSRYRTASAGVMDILHQWTPLVEQLSIDEAFLDLSDLPQDGRTLAERLQGEVREKTGLPCSIGVATNKLVAKIATDTGKARHRGADYPRSILEVPAGEEAAFLAPLPVSAMWGVGPKTAERLEHMGIHTVGEIARLSEIELVKLFGRNGLDLQRHARGIDERPVETEHEVKSISQEVTFERDVSRAERLYATLAEMSTKVAYKLRQDGLLARTVRIKIRWSDFSTHTRQLTLPEPADQDSVIEAAARHLFDQIWKRGTPVRLLGVGASGLVTGVRQLSLWDTPNEKERRLLEAVDALRARYGREIVRRGK